ncbi:Uncharacterized protein dnm_035000 [Desulfonema magnum]|uniref:Uncharacterized protein n=1 Tax=Desulfonema magnum TaxID=45655 RepID=A0A975BL23_9BACT|nr:Uncharacterized protein dnm_035000 [Desulfonema magnum]
MGTTLLVITDLGEALISAGCPQLSVFTGSRTHIPGKWEFPGRQMPRISGSQNPGTDRFFILLSCDFRMLYIP